MARWRLMAVFGIVLCGSFHAQSWAGPTGTTLTGTKDASASVKETRKYQWSIAKTASPSSYSLPKGATVPVQFSIVATRSGPVVTYSTTSISSHICLTNGTRATQGLSLTDQLEQNVGGTWTPIGSRVVVLITDELAAGETRCWDVAFTGLSLDPMAQYRNHAVASIYNWFGFEGTEYSLDVFSPLSISTTTETLDASARLDDSFLCPTGFTCVLPWTTQIISGSATLSYTVLVTNDSVFCGDLSLQNFVSLTPLNTLVVQNATGTATVNAGPCGCTGTIGYWKTHPELIPPFLPQNLGDVGGSDTLAVTTVQIALDVLKQNVFGDASNGITKVYAQLLAAKLAIQNGADPTAIWSTIVAADAFLATHSYLDWDSLTVAEKSMVTGWVSMLSNYNLGVIGPGHC